MDNFDLKKYLVENKLTNNTNSINEIVDEEKLQDAMKKSLEAQEEFKEMLSSASPDVAEKLKKAYYKTMKVRSLMYPGLMRNLGMHT
jgi:hypothetical protein